MIRLDQTGRHGALLDVCLVESRKPTRRRVRQSQSLADSDAETRRGFRACSTVLFRPQTSPRDAGECGDRREATAISDASASHQSHHPRDKDRRSDASTRTVRIVQPGNSDCQAECR